MSGSLVVAVEEDDEADEASRACRVDNCFMFAGGRFDALPLPAFAFPLSTARGGGGGRTVGLVIVRTTVCTLVWMTVRCLTCVLIRSLRVIVATVGVVDVGAVAVAGFRFEAGSGGGGPSRLVVAAPPGDFGGGRRLVNMTGSV